MLIIIKTVQLSIFYFKSLGIIFFMLSKMYTIRVYYPTFYNKNLLWSPNVLSYHVEVPRWWVNVNKLYENQFWGVFLICQSLET